MNDKTLTIVEYIRDGKSPFEIWFNSLDTLPAAKAAAALYRLETDNFSNVKPVGKGVMEYKINFGPGYRIYFGREGNTLIILLCGGSKKTQQKDITKAQELWQQYKSEKSKR